jgi:hypothetical protein
MEGKGMRRERKNIRGEGGGERNMVEGRRNVGEEEVGRWGERENLLLLSSEVLASGSFFGFLSPPLYYFYTFFFPVFFFSVFRVREVLDFTLEIVWDNFLRATSSMCLYFGMFHPKYPFRNSYFRFPISGFRFPLHFPSIYFFKEEITAFRIGLS